MKVYKTNNKFLLFFRWFVVSWTLQGVHVRDKGEKWFRICFEGIILVSLALTFYLIFRSFILTSLLLFLIHTLFWIFDSTWLVGFREVFSSFHGKGILEVIRFLELVKKDLEGLSNIDSVLVYGSLCRKSYHDRSDLDLRILRNKLPGLILFLCVIKFRMLAVFSYKIPLDLKVVDSLLFLENEMRKDELPIVIFQAKENSLNPNFSLEDLKKDPKAFLRI